jgi:hypothetical protein
MILIAFQLAAARSSFLPFATAHEAANSPSEGSNDVPVRVNDTAIKNPGDEPDITLRPWLQLISTPVVLGLR